MQATIQLYSAAGVLVADLANAYNFSWQDVFNEAGTGEFSLPYDDPQGVHIVPGAQVYCYLDGAHVFTWFVDEPPGITAVGEGEEGEQQYTVAGKGKASLLETARIYPWRGTNPQVMAQHRIYSFASPDFPNGAGWGPAHQIAPQSYIDPIRRQWVEYTWRTQDLGDDEEPINNPDDVVRIVAAAAPLGWNPLERSLPARPDAYWIWGQADVYPVGFNYFRGTFTLGVQTKLVIAATADNYYTLYLDGVPILGDQGEGVGWNEHKEIDLTLVSGTYHLAAVVENIPQEGLPQINNPAAFICAVYTIDDKENLATTIKISDSSWTALPYPVVTPGWTPGQIMLDVIEEAQARGCLLDPNGNPTFTCDFDGGSDSGGNRWVGPGGEDTYIPGYSTPIGSTALEVLNDLVSLSWVDFYFDAANDKLQMWNKGTGSVTTSVDATVVSPVGEALNTPANQTAQNLTSVEYAPHHPVTTAMFVKWSAGFMEVRNDAAIALYGRVEGFLTVDTDKVEEAVRQANEALAEVDNVEYAIVAGYDPTTGDEPYTDFKPGDFIYIYDHNGQLKSTKVFSISVSADDLGRAVFALELNNRLPSPERDTFDLTTALGRGVVGSSKVTNAKATTQTVATVAYQGPP